MGEFDNARVRDLFASPVMEHMWAGNAELNVQLHDRVLEHAREHPGFERTNRGGWRSETGLLKFCGAAGEQLIAQMRQMTLEATNRLYATFGRPPEPFRWGLSAWANVNRRGDYNQMHTHSGATWSGVYYVDSGDSEPNAAGTSIAFSDPNPARSTIFFPDHTSTNHLFRPAPGLMLLFPSYLPHFVPPHQGDRPRISIAFNVRKDPFP